MHAVAPGMKHVPPASVLRHVAWDSRPLQVGRPERRSPSASDPPALDVAIRESHAEAFAKGLAEGREQGLEQGLVDTRARIDQAVDDSRRELEAKAVAACSQQAREQEARLERIDALLDGLQAAVAQRLASLEGDAVELAYAAVCTIAGEAVASPETLAALISHAMQRHRAGPVLSVRLSHPDLALLSSSEAGQAVMARHADVVWRVDADCQERGCILDMAHGSLDARLGMQLERLRTLWVSTVDAASTACPNLEGAVPCPS